MTAREVLRHKLDLLEHVCDHFGLEWKHLTRFRLALAEKKEVPRG